MTAATRSRLIDDLPAIFHDDPFLGQFLIAFEKLLIGIDDGVALPDPGVASPSLGIEQMVAGLAHYFDPAQTPDGFLPWLASWVALSLRADLTVDRQRAFLANIAQRYRRRGTAQNLAELIGIFTVGLPQVTDDPAPFSFTVQIQLPSQDASGVKLAEYPAFINRQTAIAHALIELEKPAHTTYQLKPIFPSLQIGVHSTVGVDTLLGTAIY